MDRNDFPDGSAVKKPPAVQEMWVQSLDWEDSLEEEIFLPGKSDGQRSLVDCSPQGYKGLDMTWRLHHHNHIVEFATLCYFLL